VSDIRREDHAVLLLVPGDPLRAATVDEYFAPEAEAARRAGHEVAVVDHDALVSGDDAGAVRRVKADGAAVYRGWMMASAQYVRLFDALRSVGVVLRTAPASYATAHEFPGWYAAFSELTPSSVCCEPGDSEALERALATLPPGAAVLKDWVKSMKHYWDEAAFIPDTRDVDAARTVAERFVELRGEDLVGGLVLREFEPFVGAEARTWWVDGSCVLVTAHPDSPGSPPSAVSTDVLSLPVAELRSPFITVDLARREDDEWRVVEVGDGQVSDRPSTTPASALIAAVCAGSS
jgi:hypothetical protein